jgi:hypothetical protein
MIHRRRGDELLHARAYMLRPRNDRRVRLVRRLQETVIEDEM